MSFFAFLVLITAILLLLGTAAVVFLRLFTPSWWRHRPIRYIVLGLPVGGGGLVLLLWEGATTSHLWLVYFSIIAITVVMITEGALVVSLPFSGGLLKLLALLERRSARRDISPPNSRRRLFLKAAAVGMPATALAVGMSGVARSYAQARVFRLPILISNLPEALEGLKILHLSDIHLRYFVTLDDLEQVLSRAEPFAPDLVLVTGDIADDLQMLPRALTMIAALHPPLGTYACLGNHEHYQGLKTVRRIFDASPIPLLVNEGLTVPVASEALTLIGIDDPARLFASTASFYHRTIDAALTHSPPKGFTLLMSHRPDAFLFAAEKGVTLTLAGHTHGTQIGLARRSLAEWVGKPHFLWGHYRENGSHLYTTSGVGHWFPFRLGCPTEAPVIVLQRGDGSVTSGKTLSL